MFKYTVKRLFQSLFTIFLVVSAVFLLMRLLPTDYYFTEEQLIKLTKEQQQAILKADGYLDSPFVQLARFYKNLVKSEHRAHYFESVDMADDNTLIITLKNASDAAKLKPEQIRMQKNAPETEDTPVFAFTEVSVSPDNPKTVLAKTDMTIEKKVNYLLTCGEHSGTFSVRKAGKEVTVKDEKTENTWDYLTHMRVWLNFGNSHRVQTGVPVTEIIASKIGVSMRIGLIALAIALVIFTIWRPVVSIFSSIFFGGLYILYLYIPTGMDHMEFQELYKMIPYVVTLVVLVLTSMRNKRENQPPRSLGQSYFREER